MRSVISFILLGIIILGAVFCLSKIPLGEIKIMQGKPGRYYIDEGREQTGAANIVTSVVVQYRGFDTLGEVTILFIGAIGLGAVLATLRRKKKKEREKASLILMTGCRLIFPLILLFGAYIFIHGHLTPGGGFQGGAIIASGFLLAYLAFPGRRIRERRFNITESLGGLVFVIMGLIGLAVGGYFLLNFLPRGVLNKLFSAGVIPIIYIAIGFKVGAELAGIIDNLIEET